MHHFEELLPCWHFGLALVAFVLALKNGGEWGRVGKWGEFDCQFALSEELRGFAKLGNEASVDSAELFPEFLRAGVAKGSTGLFAAFGRCKRVLLKHPLHAQCR